MASKFKFLVLYFLAWVGLFELLRLVFLLYHFNNTRSLGLSTFFATFWYGLRMDLSMASYILAPVCLFTLLSLVIPFFQKQVVYRVYTYLLLFLVILIGIADLEIYNAWGFRIDATPLMFLSTPREALASVSHLPLILIAMIFIICVLMVFFLFRYLIRKTFFRQQIGLRLLTGLLILLVMAFLIVPIRGGLQLAPLNQSGVYFSTKNFANHAAINASWNFLHSLFSKGVSGKNPFQYVSEPRRGQIMDSLYAGKTEVPHLVNFPESKPTNVIMIIWESFTEKALHYSLEGKEVTPHFNQMVGEGIYFSNVYACGDRTNKGIPAILSGYYSLPNTTIIHSPAKSSKLKVLSQAFREKGYSTPFFYGGEPEFANIKSYLLHGGFDPIVSKNDFTSKDMNSKWGAHDGIVMQRVFADLIQTPKPFFATWLTLSSHEPFETPTPSIYKQNDILAQFMNSLHYTDQVIADFISKCKQQPWWNNTLVIITGDHGHRLPKASQQADDFRIPMLWLGGALLKNGLVNNRVISQVDIATTLSFQAGLDTTHFPYSKNFLDSTTKQWAFFSFNNGFGFVNESGRLVFDNVGKQVIQRDGNSDSKEIEAGKAIQQATYEDFLRK
jgi:phosphoglycerol transferase MdoB-like AlkP superfamily enzyme